MKFNKTLWLIGLIVIALVLGLSIMNNRNTHAPNTPSPASPAIASQQQPIKPTATPSSAPTSVPTQQIADANGRLIYFSPTSFDLVSAPAKGGDETTLMPDNDMAMQFSNAKSLAPNGKQFAYYQPQNDQIIVQVYDFDSRMVQSVATLTDTQPFELVWSPDSSKLACVAVTRNSPKRAQNTLVIDLATKTIQQVSNGHRVEVFPLAWSADSQRLLFVQDDGVLKLHTVNADGSDDQTHIEAEQIMLAQWLPDGRIIYGMTGENVKHGVYTLDPTTNMVEEIVELADDGLQGVSPDGTWLELSSLRLFNLASKKFEQVLPSQTNIYENVRVWSAWSPDLRYVTIYDAVANTTYVYKIGSQQPAIPFRNAQILGWLP